MTTLFSSAAVVETANNTGRMRAGRVALWVGQVLVAAAFLAAGGSKLVGVPAMVVLFDAIGIGQWFRYVTGAIEMGSAIALLVPSLAPYGALALVATMVGAVFTHIFIVGGSPLPPLVLLAASAAIAWARRDQF